MKYNSSSRPPPQESVFLNCKCGEQLEVIFTRHRGDSETEEFNCPECQREHTVKASMAITVEAIKIRKTI